MSNQTTPSNTRALLLALFEAEIMPAMEPDGTLISLRKLEELEEAGWRFLPPAGQASS